MTTVSRFFLGGLMLGLCACESYVLPQQTLEITLSNGTSVGEALTRIEKVALKNGLAWSNTKGFEENYETSVRRGFEYYYRARADEYLMTISVDSIESTRGLFLSNDGLKHAGFSKPRIIFAFHQRSEKGFDEQGLAFYQEVRQQISQIPGIRVSDYRP